MSIKKARVINKPAENSDSFDVYDFRSGKDGIVWATYELRQSEIIQSTLLAQDIYSELKRDSLNGKEVVLIKVTNTTDVNSAIDFIWRNDSGLRLKSDWSYPAGHSNKSFERWLSGK